MVPGSTSAPGAQHTKTRPLVLFSGYLTTLFPHFVKNKMGTVRSEKQEVKRSLPGALPQSRAESQRAQGGVYEIPTSRYPYDLTRTTPSNDIHPFSASLRENKGRQRGQMLLTSNFSLLKSVSRP